MTDTNKKVANREELRKKYPLLFINKEDQEKKLKEKFNVAWYEARRGAAMLKNDFEAKKVWVFGSLLDSSRFNDWSDIDLAVEGVPDSRYYSAVGAITRLITQYKVDLLDINECKEYIRKEIIREGKLI